MTTSSVPAKWANALRSCVLAVGVVMIVAGCGGQRPIATGSPSASERSSTASSPSRSAAAAGATAAPDTASAAASEASPAAQVDPGPPLPKVAVPSIDGRSSTPVQKFADDVAAGDIEGIIRKCWTMAPARLRATFNEQGRRTTLLALGTAGQGTERGWVWQAEGWSVGVCWAELNSPYACLKVTGGTQQAGPTPEDAMHLIRRLDGRLRGAPLNPSDTTANYPLLCDRLVIRGGGPSGIPTNDDHDDAVFLSPTLQEAIHQLATQAVTFDAPDQEGLGVNAAGGAYARVVAAGDFCLGALRL